MISRELKLPKSSVYRWIGEINKPLQRQIAEQTTPDWQQPNRNGGFRTMRKELRDGFNGFSRMCEIHKTMTMMGAPEKELAQQREQIEWCAKQLSSMKQDLDKKLENYQSQEDF
jgi:hypothetical protein